MTMSCCVRIAFLRRLDHHLLPASGSEDCHYGDTSARLWDVIKARALPHAAHHGRGLIKTTASGRIRVSGYPEYRPGGPGWVRVPGITHHGGCFPSRGRDMKLRPACEPAPTRVWKWNTSAIQRSDSL